MIDEYGQLMLKATEELIHVDRLDYHPEVAFMRILANHLTTVNWPSITKGLGSERPDMRTTNSDGSIVITTHAKQFVLDYPTRIQSGKQWDGSLARQHLGISPGKSNNAVHDITVKLEGIRTGTHVSFFLVKFANTKSLGDGDIKEFIRLARLDDSRWTYFSRDWVHPRDSAHHVHAFLWCRPI